MLPSPAEESTAFFSVGAVADKNAEALHDAYVCLRRICLPLAKAHRGAVKRERKHISLFP